MFDDVCRRRLFIIFFISDFEDSNRTGKLSRHKFSNLTYAVLTHTSRLNSLWAGRVLVTAPASPIGRSGRQHRGGRDLWGWRDPPGKPDACRDENGKNMEETAPLKEEQMWKNLQKVPEIFHLFDD